jgi:hypothetical protein
LGSSTENAHNNSAWPISLAALEEDERGALAAGTWLSVTLRTRPAAEAISAISSTEIREVFFHIRGDVVVRVQQRGQVFVIEISENAHYKVVSKYRLAKNPDLAVLLDWGPMVLASVGPILLMISAFRLALASCQIAWRSLLYFATEICALVIPAVIGTCAGSRGRGSTETVPSAVTHRFAAWLFHSASF